MYFQNEQLMLEVGSFAWYSLPVRDQKRAILLLAATQTPVTLSAVMDVLNVETYLKVNVITINAYCNIF